MFALSRAWSDPAPFTTDCRRRGWESRGQHRVGVDEAGNEWERNVEEDLTLLEGENPATYRERVRVVAKGVDECKGGSESPAATVEVVEEGTDLLLVAPVTDLDPDPLMLIEVEARDLVAELFAAQLITLNMTRNMTYARMPSFCWPVRALSMMSAGPGWSSS